MAQRYSAIFSVLTLSVLLGAINVAPAQKPHECSARSDPGVEEQTPPVCSTFESSEISLATVIPKAHPLHATCPSPTVRRERRCVLENDVTLTETLGLPSFTHLDCQGYTITPSVAGTTTENTGRSQPEVAILLRQAYGVKIHNCVIAGFDFGIFAL